MRRYATPAARVANNPLFVKDVTPWPINISWALLADRSSCFAGIELALAFAPLSDGTPPDDQRPVSFAYSRAKPRPTTCTTWRRNMAATSSSWCRQDKAWNNDPFAASPDYRLAETREDRWRIYVAGGGAACQIPANQLNPCLLQNVSVNVLVTSIALIHFAFL